MCHRSWSCCASLADGTYADIVHTPYYNSENEVRALVDLEVNQGRAKGLQFDPASLAQESAKILGVVRLIYGASIALGVVLIVLGLLVKQFPVPATVLGLILYIGANAGYAFLNPASLISGIIIKILIVVGLVRAVQAAIAYQKETNQIVGKPNVVGLGADL